MNLGSFGCGVSKLANVPTVSVRRSLLIYFILTMLLE